MIASSRILLDQLAEVLEKLSPQEYSLPLDILNGASIGAHVRHTLEFYLCLVNQCENGVVNYDLRERDQSLENLPVEALKCIAALKVNLEARKENFPLTLEMSYDQNGDQSEAMPSSYFRELSYVIEHTVHHMALLKIGLGALESAIPVSPSFGVAVSTLRYRKTQA